MNDAIRPFRITIEDTALADLRRRLAATRWPDKETVADTTQGVRLATMRALVAYWEKEYDWRVVEKTLNARPQFLTNIDGIDIHFIHVRSSYANALPIIITHGWPGSILEYIKIIDALTSGGAAADAFDVVIPSLPGYGFSERPTEPGWDAPRIARAWTTLMKRLGYQKFVAQGGDWGAIVTEQMAVEAPPELVAIHTNLPGAVPLQIIELVMAGAPPPREVTVIENTAYEQLVRFYAHGLGFVKLMTNRPQTLYGIADSPVGLAAWMIDHDAQSYGLIERVFAGQREGLTRDDVLDNITLYWLTNTGISSARLFWENKVPFFRPKRVDIPVAVSVFPDEIYVAPRSWVERAYRKLLRYNQLPKGGHFAAWEQPDAFVSELRASFRAVR
jgi:pimeloyl-ACP methyl ester carboxylesterase